MENAPNRELEDGDDDVTCSVDVVSGRLTGKPDGKLENASNDVAGPEDVPDGKAHTDQTNYETLRTYFEAFIFKLRQAESEFQRAEEFVFMVKFTTLQTIAESQSICLKSFQTWAFGTTHFRCDVVFENGENGFKVEAKVIDEWNKMKEDRDSFKERFQKEFCDVNETDIWTQGKGKKSKLSWWIARRHNATNEEFKEKLFGMSCDLEIAAKALSELTSDYKNIHSTFFIPRYQLSELKDCLARYMSVVRGILHHTKCYV